jgi:hypothetical protein
LQECLAGAQFDPFAIECAREMSFQKVEVAVVFMGVLGRGNAGGIDDLEE